VVQNGKLLFKYSLHWANHGYGSRIVSKSEPIAKDQTTRVHDESRTRGHQAAHQKTLPEGGTSHNET